MCHNCTKNHKINRFHIRCLCLLYNEKWSSFEEVLEKNSSAFIHDRYLRALATVMYKVYHKISWYITYHIWDMKPKE